MQSILMTRRNFLATGIASLGTSIPLSSLLNSRWNRPQSIQFQQLHAGGDLAVRAYQNFQRLQSKIYRPPYLFKGPKVAWPGDFEGRALLGLTLISRSTRHEAPVLHEIVQKYPIHLNAKGYFGDILDDGAINEQQLAGHGWVLRGLCEYYEWTENPNALAMVERIITNLVLPTQGKYKTYSADPALRGHDGRISGSIKGSESGWLLSSDIGCIFILLDGITHAWMHLRSPQLRVLIEEMISRFLELDLVAMQAQTHATLTCLRGMLRLYQHTNDAALLQAVEQRYRLYRNVAMTEHYANFNWFGRPDSWTEPCAIIDSFIIAAQLWRFTGQPDYLQDAHLIWFNGLGRGQRANGGYGTDTCLGIDNPFLSIKLYEAFFCCTMRGGEGHARSIENLYCVAPGELFIPFFNDSEASIDAGGGRVRLRQSTGYPYEGGVQLEVLDARSTSPIRLKWFAPEWTAGHRLTLNGEHIKHEVESGFVESTLILRLGDIIRYDFSLIAHAVPSRNPENSKGYFSFRAGPLMLVRPGYNEITIPRGIELIREGMGIYRTASPDCVELSRINDMNTIHAAPTERCSRQALFKES